MKIRVLGCHGGATPEHRLPGFLLGEHLAVDAGCLASTLTLDEQAALDDVLLTSAQLEHVAELGALADNTLGRRKTSTQVHCTQAVQDTLKKHLFNNVVMPDYTSLPSASAAALKFKAHAHGKKFQIQNLEVSFVPMKHPTDSSGLILRWETGCLVFAGDTGVTQNFWDQVNKLKEVTALFLECSYPTSMQKVADVSGHLTPTTLASELKKLTQPGFPVFAYHLKPSTFSETRKELRALKLRELHLCRAGDIYEV